MTRERERETGKERERKERERCPWLEDPKRANRTISKAFRLWYAFLSTHRYGAISYKNVLIDSPDKSGKSTSSCNKQTLDFVVNVVH